MENFITKLSACFNSVAVKLPEILSSIGGWVSVLFLIVANFCAGYELTLIMILFCIVSDAFWGIMVAIKCGRFVVSELGRDTLIKMAAYGNAMLVLIGIERLISVDFHITTVVAATIICAVELWSISGNVLIIKPNFKFFRLMRPALKGEIGRKLNIAEDMVDQALDKDYDTKRV